VIKSRISSSSGAIVHFGMLPLIFWVDFSDGIRFGSLQEKILEANEN